MQNLSARQRTLGGALEFSGIGVHSAQPVTLKIEPAPADSGYKIQRKFEDGSLVGPVAVQALRTLHFDAVFMGVHGMSAKAGFTTPNLSESETNKAFVEATQQLVVLADHTKWNVTGLSAIAPLHEADTVVTDVGLAATALDTLEGHVRRVLVADPSEPDIASIDLRGQG